MTTFNLGKVDYNRSGRRNCMATIELTWDGSRCSIRASIWNPRGTDIYIGGQCVEEVAAYFPGNKLAQRLVAIWRAWHLNDMKAGSPAQEAWLAANPVTAVYPESHYVKASEALAAVGLNPGPGNTAIPYLAMSGAPTHPQGVSMWGDIKAYQRNTRQRIRWLDLPEHIRAHVIARATTD